MQSTDPIVAKVADFGASCRLYISTLKADETADRDVNNPSKIN